MNGPFPQNLEAVAPQADRLYMEHSSLYNARLARHIDYWHDWASSWGLPVVTTEAWGPVNYDDVPGDAEGRYWKWVKLVGEVGLRHALCRGWIGVATSNFAEPHFPGMWRDVSWHQNQTSAIVNYTPDSGCVGSLERS